MTIAVFPRVGHHLFSCDIVFQVGFLRLMMAPCWSTLPFIFLSFSMVAASPPGCKIRITDRGLEMCKRRSFNHAVIYYGQVWSVWHFLLMCMCTCNLGDKVGHFVFCFSYNQRPTVHLVGTNWNVFVPFAVMTVFVFSVKFETQKFVEEELSNITMPEMKGKEGRFQYTITEY